MTKVRLNSVPCYKYPLINVSDLRLTLTHSFAYAHLHVFELYQTIYKSYLNLRETSIGSSYSVS